MKSEIQEIDKSTLKPGMVVYLTSDYAGADLIETDCVDELSLAALIIEVINEVGKTLRYVPSVCYGQDASDPRLIASHPVDDSRIKMYATPLEAWRASLDYEREYYAEILGNVDRLLRQVEEIEAK